MQDDATGVIAYAKQIGYKFSSLLNPNADIDDGSCDYSCHDNGDYSLSFDGVNDYAVLGSNFNLSTDEDFSISFKLNLSDYNEEESIILYQAFLGQLHFDFGPNNALEFDIKGSDGSWTHISSETTYNEFIQYTATYNYSSGTMKLYLMKT